MMRKKILILASLSLIVLAAIAVSIYFVVQQNSAKRQGKLVFAETYNQGHLVDKVELITAQDKVVLHQDKSYWKVVNRGGYYADFDLMHLFLSSLNQSVYSVQLALNADEKIEKHLNNPLSDEENSGMLIRTYAGETLLDEVIIGDGVDDDNYFMARTPDDKSVWLINGVFGVPNKSEDWLLRSLVSITEDSIESFVFNEKEVKRINSQGSFFDDQGKLVLVDTLLEVLQGVNISDALSEDEFNAKVVFDKIDTMTVDISYGLKFIFLFYSSGEDLWFEVKMETSSLPLSVVNDFINENSFLYDGWFFKAVPEQGFVFQNLLRRFQ